MNSGYLFSQVLYKKSHPLPSPQGEFSPYPISISAYQLVSFSNAKENLVYLGSKAPNSGPINSSEMIDFSQCDPYLSKLPEFSSCIPVALGQLKCLFVSASTLGLDKTNVRRPLMFSI